MKRQELQTGKSLSKISERNLSCPHEVSQSKQCRHGVGVVMENLLQWTHIQIHFTVYWTQTSLCLLRNFRIFGSTRTPEGSSPSSLCLFLSFLPLSLALFWLFGMCLGTVVWKLSPEGCRTLYSHTPQKLAMASGMQGSTFLRNLITWKNDCVPYAKLISYRADDKPTLHVALSQAGGVLQAIAIF